MEIKASFGEFRQAILGLFFQSTTLGTLYFESTRRDYSFREVRTDLGTGICLQWTLLDLGVYYLGCYGTKCFGHLESLRVMGLSFFNNGRCETKYFMRLCVRFSVLRIHIMGQNSTRSEFGEYSSLS